MGVLQLLSLTDSVMMPRWVSELPHTSLLTLPETVHQLPLCLASLLTCLPTFPVYVRLSLHMAVYIGMMVPSVVSFFWQVWRSPWV